MYYGSDVDPFSVGVRRWDSQSYLYPLLLCAYVATSTSWALSCITLQPEAEALDGGGSGEMLSMQAKTGSG